MADVLILCGIALFGLAVAISAATFRSSESARYWAISFVWIAAVGVLFTTIGVGSTPGAVAAATILLGFLPIVASFGVARLTRTSFWMATGFAGASWAVTFFVALSLVITWVPK